MKSQVDLMENQVLIKTDDENSIFGAILKDSSNYILTYFYPYVSV